MAEFIPPKRRTLWAFIRGIFHIHYFNDDLTRPLGPYIRLKCRCGAHRNIPA